VGSGHDVTIAELAQLVAQTVGYRGEMTFDNSKPDGTPRKLMDSGLLNNLGWTALVGLAEGLGKAYEDFARSTQ
jgi:GDP-L-fucose synthase